MPRSKHMSGPGHRPLLLVRDGRLDEPVDDLLDALRGMRVPPDRQARLSTALRPRLDTVVSENPVSNGDLLLSGGCCGVADTAVSGPGVRFELQSAVFAVSGVGMPVATRLALRNRIPVGGGRSAGFGGGRTKRRRNEPADDGGLDERLGELSHVKQFGTCLQSVTDSINSRDKKFMAFLWQELQIS